MAYFKEIVTKTVIGKGKKKISKINEAIINGGVDNVLGCWVINHRFSGGIKNNNIIINGNYDINIWYSYDNNTKTNVIVNNYSYEEVMNVRINDNSKITNDSEIIVRALNQPSVVNVDVLDNKLSIDVVSEMGVEVIGDSIVRVSTTDEYDDYEEIIDEEVINEDEININPDYLK